MHHLSKPQKDCKNVWVIQKYVQSNNRESLHVRYKKYLMFSEMGFNHYQALYQCHSLHRGCPGLRCGVKKAKAQSSTAKKAAATHCWKWGGVPVLAYSSDSADLASGTVCLHPEDKSCAENLWGPLEILVLIWKWCPRHGTVKAFLSTLPTSFVMCTIWNWWTDIHLMLAFLLSFAKNWFKGWFIICTEQKW